MFAPCLRASSSSVRACVPRPSFAPKPCSSAAPLRIPTTGACFAMSRAVVPECSSMFRMHSMAHEQRVSAMPPQRALSSSNGGRRTRQFARERQPTFSLLWAGIAITGAALVLQADEATMQGQDTDKQEEKTEELQQDDGGVGTGLSSKEFRKFTLGDTITISPDSNIFRFELANVDGHTHFPVTSFVLLRYKNADGKYVVRPYTPIMNSEKGFMSLVIKEYPEGNMSKHVHEMEVGDTIEIKGPIKKLTYEPNMAEHIVLIAGGTGLTPMLQVLQAVAHNPEDKTKVDFVYANKSTRDILLLEYLQAISADDNLTMHFVVDKAKPDQKVLHSSGSKTVWPLRQGYVDKPMLEELLPSPVTEQGDAAKVMVMVCGPPPMVKSIAGPKAKDRSQGPLDGILKDLNFAKDQVFKF